MKRSRVITYALAALAVVALACEAEGERKPDGTFEEPETGETKCLKKKLASLKDQKPDPSKLACDERILYLVAFAKTFKPVEIRMSHNAWGARTDTRRTTVGVSQDTIQHTLRYSEDVVTYKDHAVQWTVLTTNPEETDYISCFIYDKPPNAEGLFNSVPIDTESIGNRVVRARPQAVCVAPKVKV